MKRFRNLLFRLRFIRYAIKHPGRASSDLYVKYPQGHDFNGRRVLNLGCGNSVYKHPNVVNLDGESCSGADVLWDLSQVPLPFKDGEFDLVIANHILEHVPNWWECFKELARITKVGGIVEVWLPSAGSDSQLGYRDHINTINSYSFGGIRHTIRNSGNAWEMAQFDKNGQIRDLSLIKEQSHIIRAWWTVLAPASLQGWMAKHLRNVEYEHGYFFQKKAPLKTFDEYSKWGKPNA